MAQTRPEGTVSDRLAAAETAALVGRVEERARLGAMLSSPGLAAVFVHGPGGIGKTVLIAGTLAALPLKAVTLDGRRLEPTVPGALVAIGAALGGPAPPSAAAAAEQVAAAGVDVLVFDSFERLNLLDGWIRNDLIGALPATVSTLLVGRRGPNVAWRTAPRWRRLLGELAVGPLRAGDVDRLLAAQGIRGENATRIRAFARGHPLAVLVASEALARRPGLSLGSGAPAEVVEELFTVILEDLGPRERVVAEAASVLRRVTLPLLAAIDDEPDVEQTWRILRGLPFTVTTAGGVELSGLAAPVLLEALELRDPGRVRTLRRRAARAILESLAQGPDWESTADLMHLVQNPLIRNAYAPPGMLQHPAKQARREDHDEIVAIVRRFAGEESARLGEWWWQARRDTFAVVRAADGRVAGFSVTATVDDQAGSSGEDPLLQAVGRHLSENPMAPGAEVLFISERTANRHVSNIFLKLGVHNRTQAARAAVAAGLAG